MVSSTGPFSPAFASPRPKARTVVADKAVSGIPLVFFIIGCVALDWRYSESEVNIGNIIFLFSCMAAWIAAFVTQRGRLRLRTWNVIDTIFLAYVALIGASTYWSIVPSETLPQSIFIGGMWATTLVLGNQPTERLVAYIVHTAFWIAVLSLIVAFFLPEAFQGRTGELRGVYFHQLRLGLFMSVALGLLCLAVLNGQSNVISKNSLVIFLYFLILAVVCAWAYARLYTFFAVIALAITAFLPNKTRARAVFLLLIGSLILWLVLDQNSVLGALGDQGVDLSLSGRTSIWEKTLMLVRDRTSLGYGFGSFDANAFDGYWRGYYRPQHPHNSYLQAYFETGWVGLVLTLALGAAHFGVGLRGTSVRRRKSYSLFLVLTAILGALTGSVYAGKITAFFALMMLAVSLDAAAGSVQARAPREHDRDVAS